MTEERIEEEASARRQLLQFIEKACAEAGVACETVCETSDHPYDAILKIAEARKAI